MQGKIERSQQKRPEAEPGVNRGESGEWGLQKGDGRVSWREGCQMLQRES
jgi:hypothetical protein